jgi:hypothetical protein
MEHKRTHIFMIQALIFCMEGISATYYVYMYEISVANIEMAYPI